MRVPGTPACPGQPRHIRGSELLLGTEWDEIPGYSSRQRVHRHCPEEQTGGTPFLEPSVPSPDPASCGIIGQLDGQGRLPSRPEPRSRRKGAGHQPLSRDRINSPQGQPLNDRIQWHIQEKHPTGREQHHGQPEGPRAGLWAPGAGAGVFPARGWSLRNPSRGSGDQALQGRQGGRQAEASPPRRPGLEGTSSRDVPHGLSETQFPQLQNG